MTYSDKLHSGEFAELTYILNYDEENQTDIEIDIDVYQIIIKEKIYPEPDNVMEIFVITNSIVKAQARALKLFDEMMMLNETDLDHHRSKITSFNTKKMKCPWVFLEKELMEFHPVIKIRKPTENE